MASRPKQVWKDEGKLCNVGFIDTVVWFYTYLRWEVRFVAAAPSLIKSFPISLTLPYIKFCVMGSYTYIWGNGTQLFLPLSTAF